MSREGSPLTSGAGEGHQDVEFRSHALAVEPAQKPKQKGFRELPGCSAHGGLGRTVGLKTAWKLRDPLLILCPLHFFHLAVPEFHPFVISQSSNKYNVSLSSVS